MAVYVMSDIHGAYDAFMELLELIGLSDKDTLYILGDVIDRGPKGVELLQYIKDRPNMRLILGNHEYMCLKYFAPVMDMEAVQRWNRNANEETLAGFDRLTPEEKETLLDYLRSLPDELRVTVNGITYILVHGYIGSNTHDRVWSRPLNYDMPDIADNERLIIGHTPVCYYLTDGKRDELLKYSRRLTNAGSHFKILRRPGFTDIDCCTGYFLSAARLACLRLDDFREFYVKAAYPE